MNVRNIVILICEFLIRMLFTIFVLIYCCSNLLWLICEREITIIIIWYCYSNKCEKWYMKSNTKSIIEFALEINGAIIDLFHYNLLTRFGEFYDLFFNSLWLIKCSILLLNFSNNFIYITFIWILYGVNNTIVGFIHLIMMLIWVLE